MKIVLKITSMIFPALLSFSPVQQSDITSYNASFAMNTNVIDGPYVLYRNDSVFVRYIESYIGIKSVRTESVPVAQKENITLLVNTDEPGKTLSVKLKPKHTNEKAETGRVKKMLVISDIEGNFAALRKLLLGNNVIDENFNWMFEKGHLVFIGDFVDRGTMVTEVLWLIYSLEEKAKAAGGQVHYILGNHEIMNMSGEVKYVHGRYLEHAALMNRNYIDLFGPNAEIGRWLATKNVVERIGDILFTHGGISAYINYMQIPIKELNDLSRAYYTDTTYKYPDKRLEVLYSDFGPFWYRGYYSTPKASIPQIDSTLNFYRISHITTGHTIVNDKISSLYDGKIFNTDVHHAGGHSEALLVENGKFFRVNASGERSAVISLPVAN